MKIKKTLSLFAIICVASVLYGCSNKIPDEVQDSQGSETTTSVSEQTSSVTEEVQNNSSAENTSSFVKVMLGDTNIEQAHENNVITSVKWQKLRLEDEHSSLYPELSNAFAKYNEDSMTEAKALMYEFTSIAKEMEGDEFNPAYCQAGAEIYIQRADKQLVSFLEGVEQYTGGVHPDYYVKGINLNTNSGQEVALTDVLTDTKELPSILEKKITEKYSGVAFYNLEDTFSKYKPEEFTWTIDYQGITFWFSPYEIAAYSVGTLSARLWFDEFPDMFNKEYSEAPENYAIALPVGKDIEFDLVKGDEKKDSVYTEYTLDQYGSYNMLTTVVNGKTFTDEINYAYYFDVYLVHIDDKNYIYSDSTSDSDYHMISVVDINGDKLQQTQQLSGTQFYGEFVEEGFETGTMYRQVFNNPDEFRLNTRFDILGTRFGFAGYKVNEKDGRAEMTDEDYNIEDGASVKSIIPLEVELLPDNSTKEIPSGTEFYPLRTDGKTYIDMKTEDGQEVKFHYDNSEYPWKINGISEEECFENILYAG